MLTRLVVVRHGNTFDEGDIVLRVGARTDLPLSQSGYYQAIALGRKLKTIYGDFSASFVSELQRTKQTAHCILSHLPLPCPLHTRLELNEIDYGIDEGKPESTVLARIGKKALDAWDLNNEVPKDWLVDPDLLRRRWRILASDILKEHMGKTLLIVTSNGVARFVDGLLAENDLYFNNRSAKLRTAAFGELVHDGQTWSVVRWGEMA